jgi:hypothetical protein
MYVHELKCYLLMHRLCVLQIFISDVLCSSSVPCSSTGRTPGTRIWSTLYREQSADGEQWDSSQSAGGLLEDSCRAAVDRYGKIDTSSESYQGNLQLRDNYAITRLRRLLILCQSSDSQLRIISWFSTADFSMSHLMVKWRSSSYQLIFTRPSAALGKLNRRPVIGHIVVSHLVVFGQVSWWTAVSQLQMSLWSEVSQLLVSW